MQFADRDPMLLSQCIDRGLETREAPLHRVPQVTRSRLFLSLAQVLPRTSTLDLEAMD
jgi:hypothetical protein